MAPSSALPIGSAPLISETKPVKVDPSQPGSGILNSLLALLAPSSSTAPTASGSLGDVIGNGEEKPKPTAGESSVLGDEEILMRDIVGFVIMYVLLPSFSFRSFTSTPHAHLTSPRLFLSIPSDLT